MITSRSPNSSLRLTLAMRRRIRGMLMAGKQYSLDSRMDLVTTLVQSARPSDMPTMRENSLEYPDYHDTGEREGGEEKVLPYSNAPQLHSS